MKAEELAQEAVTQKEQLVADRRYLHTHPGCGFDIADTVSYVRDALAAMGYEPKECGKAGLVALAGGKQPGRVFLIRADMDGLPIREEADVTFAADNGRMHACGHDMHTAMLLGAARLLKAHEDEICGTVKLMFQPAEELFEGSKDMLDAGLLQAPDVDAGLMIHVMANMPIPVGTSIVCDGGVSAPAADYFTIRIQGKGCHGSMPNTGVDPVNAAAHIILALQEISARELAISDEAVLTIGSIHGGGAANVIPDTVELSGSIRTYDEDIRTFLKTRMAEIAQSTAATFRASAEVSFGSGCPTLVNDAELSDCTVRYIRELFGPDRAMTAGQMSALAGTKKAAKTTGSEDFAYVSHALPTIMLALAAGDPNTGCHYPQHHPKAKFDEDALPYGSAIYAYTAMRWLEEHSDR